jgi:hypothetical protein
MGSEDRNMRGNPNQVHSPSDSSASPGPVRLWAGSGTGKQCDFCGKAITIDDVQYDLEVEDSAPVADRSPRARTLSFHRGCYDPWRAGRFKVG